MTLLRRVWRHQRCNQNRISKNRHHNDEKKKCKRKNNDLQSIYIKRKVELTGVHIATGVNSRCYRKVCRSWSTIDTRRVNIVTNPIISREWVKDREVLTISETYRLSLWHRYPLVVTQVMVVTVAFSKWWLHLYYNWYHFFCCKVLCITAPHCRFRGVSQDMNQTYLYLWYPLFHSQWDICDQQNYLVKGHHLHSGTWNYRTGLLFVLLSNDI
jgi:hypothetical protein